MLLMCWLPLSVWMNGFVGGNTPNHFSPEEHNAKHDSMNDVRGKKKNY